MEGKLLHQETTRKIIEAFYSVYNALGYGFLEKVYENALAIVLSQMGCTVLRQDPIKVFFQGQLVGDYYADLLVDGCVIVELKAAKTIADEHEGQLLNYLKATEMEVGLVLNFGPKATFIRRVLVNARKQSRSAPGKNIEEPCPRESA